MAAHIVSSVRGEYTKNFEHKDSEKGGYGACRAKRAVNNCQNILVSFIKITGVAVKSSNKLCQKTNVQ